MTRTEYDVIDALEEACRNTSAEETIDLCNAVISEAERIKEIAEAELDDNE